jgi:hypothetical protein
MPVDALYGLAALATQRASGCYLDRAEGDLTLA